MKRVVLIFTIIFLTTIHGFTQDKGFKIPDSLKNKSFEEIYQNYRKVNQDTVKSIIYLQSYIQKGIEENEHIVMARGYALLSSFQKDDNQKLEYLDKSIAISENLENPFFPAFPYSAKGGYYYYKWNLKEALRNFFLSIKYAEKNNGSYYIYSGKNNIALIKSRLGKYDEALDGFKECLEHKTRTGINDTLSYLSTTLDMSETYTKMKSIDSSSFYNKEGVRLSKLMNTDPYNFYYKFVFNEGVNHFYNENYQEALDSINKSLPFLPETFDDNYLIRAYLYLGKVYDKIGEKNNAKVYYQKIDSIFQQSNNVSLEVREAYSALVKYYKDKNNTDNQLVYIEKLLLFDSILRSDYNELNDILVKQYDTPELLAEKERLVDQLDTKNSKYTIYIYILIFSVFVFIGLFSYQFYKRKLYQKRFEVLTKKDSTKETKKIQKQKKNIWGDIGISSIIVEEVLSKLEEFEDQKGFLSSQMTITKLASVFSTNNKYLSKIINVYKEKSFSQYINDLRINHATEQLKIDRKFRNYTIKAIARETGFNTAEAFSKSFYNKHGIYPSYFVKRLEKLNNT